jgi:RimJ/RimL family protein N-acetyltransferase
MKVLRQSTILSTESQLAYFKELVMPELHSDYPSQILLAIYVSDQFVGYGGITNINWELLKGEISFLLSPRYSEDTQEYKEIFEDYLKIISVIAFEVLGLNKLFTETFSFRESHLGVLSKTGFVIEGVFIMNCKKQGNYFDSVFHARFNSKILGDS